MKPPYIITLLIAVHPWNVDCRAATLVQTFEPGEDTSDWGASFTGGAIVTTFLDPSLGGANAGGGTSNTQSFSRSFANNTVGLMASEAYDISMYVQVDSFDGAAGGLFEIVNGDYGSGNAANLRIATIGPGDYKWQARDNNAGWIDVGLTLDLAQPYRVMFSIDPDTFTYSTTVQMVDLDGTVLDTGSLSGLAFDQNVINNQQNDSLLFYIQASAGGTQARVDNINIQSVPEPSAALLALGGAASWVIRRKRK